ncbi:MAG: hypothetical protein ABIJ45_11835 [Candidatus Zixiibacteriota bacterium]
MTKSKMVLTVILTLLTVGSQSYALPPIEGKIFGITPLVNEVSFYKNVDDDGNNRGKTLQIVAINSLKLGTNITLEFTADFNWDMSYKDKDEYIELSLVKPIYKIISVNYQRIYSTFESKPINQFGIRLSL